MAKRDNYDVLVTLTNNAALLWKEARAKALLADLIYSYISH